MNGSYGWGGGGGERGGQGQDYKNRMDYGYPPNKSLQIQQISIMETPGQDLSGGQHYPPFECLGSDEFHITYAAISLSVQVDSVFTLPLMHLCNPVNYGYTKFTSRAILPVFINGPHRVWGLTSVILEQALLLLVPEYYPQQFWKFAFKPLLAKI